MKDHIGNRFGSVKLVVLPKVLPTLASLSLLVWWGGVAGQEIQVMLVACAAVRRAMRLLEPCNHLRSTRSWGGYNTDDAGARPFAKGRLSLTHSLTH